ncbi:hypothetical protein SERLA73DRAFT_69160 [Serpula lacrymans var. lacrymans S7.3]|uniref:Uncharacterized protein n=2 Tax=Serpula lacrymans var. lacrymans TaxID=341189 RepID=F8PK17_SERL3|nr:uncharacterized protein SERLADRAFT_433050 [Serpula lacrymans var. lacrymans S7.9]EGO03257.1 hypothetical protein SERLA73DRAFT_69160 [Serpula lacrymans var. lacrymans S7.3]EGO29040.1 hypothetical protein SERLADRAFT_433050 [Serpula lacrymans var. lacrymans S7.9]
MLEEELREWREGSSQSIPMPRWPNGMHQHEEASRPTRVPHLPSPQFAEPSLTTGHPFPGCHPPVSPQYPPPSPPDLVPPTPIPSSPPYSFATSSIVPKANTVKELQVI